MFLTENLNFLIIFVAEQINDYVKEKFSFY